jgi:hypothetical protein
VSVPGTDADPQSHEDAGSETSEGSVPIEILVPTGGDDTPAVEAHSRLDIVVRGEMYPTARLQDGRYVAWWHEADAPAPEDPAVEEWVTAPTRFLAAATVHELWEDPAAFASLRPAGAGSADDDAGERSSVGDGPADPASGSGSAGAGTAGPDGGPGSPE